MDRRVLTVFVASPSDLADERFELRAEVDHINKTVAKQLGWHVDLTGWEDTRLGFRRPQDLINKDVDACELFIGMLWRRWGQPTGQFGSGFEEEFVRARDRRLSTGKPEIWLHFKFLRDDEKVDPGDQLKKVLTFREDLKEKNELLYKEFADTAEFKTFIFDSLADYLFELAKAPVKTASQDRALPVQQESRASKAPRGKHAKPKNAKALPNDDVFKLFTRIRKELRQSGLRTLDISDRTRLLLLSTAWYSMAHDNEILGAHELNLAFAKRKAWVLSSEETILANRTMIADKDTVCPAWYWLKDSTKVRPLLSYFASSDGNPAVRVGAFWLLAKYSPEIDLETMKQGLGDPVTIEPALALARRLAHEEFIPLLRTVVDNPESNKRSDALQVLIELTCHKNQDDAFELLISDADRVPGLLRELHKQGQLHISKALLEEAVSKASPAVREFAATVLRETKQLSNEIANALLNDPDQRVRKVAVLALFDLGQPLDMPAIRALFPDRKGAAATALALSHDVDPDDFLPLVLDKLTPEELLSKIQFFSPDGVAAYWVLANKYFNQAEARIRQDLSDNFESLKREGEKGLVVKWRPDLLQFRQNQYVDAALSGVALNATPQDISLARRVLSNPEVPRQIATSAIAILSKFASAADVDMLLAAAEKTYGNTRALAVKTALQLAPNAFDVASKLVAHENSTVRKLAARTLLVQDWKISEPIARDLLSNKRTEIRVLGVALHSLSTDESGFSTMLDKYLVRETYYYNVVTWLDRVLYSPEPYRDAFRKELRDMVFGDEDASEGPGLVEYMRQFLLRDIH